jgi:4-amino-4-deoxy-L-arabinose transferase
MTRSGAAAFALAAAVFLAGLGSYGFIEPSDARYAEIAREMHVSGDFVYPTLLGIRHFHKPPLIHWLVQPGLSLLGENPWGARIVLAAQGLLLCLLLHRFARRCLPGASAWAVALVATTPAVMGASHVLTIDLLLTLLVSAALLGWFELRRGAGGRGARLMLWGALGLAFLAKGPVGWVLPALVIVAATSLHRGPAQGRVWGAKWGIPLALAIALPWYLWVAVRTPGLLSYFLGEQVAGRLSEGGLGHPHPWYYFIGVAPLLGMPWLLLAPRGWRLLRARDPRLADFLALWAVVPPLFFSLPATKLPLYVLPAYPAVALLAAVPLAEPGRAGRPLRIAGGLMLALAACLAAAGTGGLPLGGDVRAVPAADLRSLLAAPAVVLAAAGTLVLAAAVRRPAVAASAMALALAFLAGWVSLNGHRLPLHSAEGVGRAVAAEYRAGDVVACYRKEAQGLPYYSGQAPMPLLALIPRETRFEPPGRRPPLADEQEFAALWRGPARVLAVTTAAQVAALPGAVRLEEAGGYVLCANRTAGRREAAPR